MPDTPLAAEWTAWFREHGSRLLLFSRGQTRSSADAQDVLQDAIMRLWKSYAKKDDDDGPPPMPLAYTAIRNTAIDHARRNGRRTKREQASDYVVSEADPGADWFGTAALEEQEQASALQEALEKLPEKFKEVVVLKVWGEQTFAQIAETLGIPLNTAASRYRYGLEALRKILKPNSI